MDPDKTIAKVVFEQIGLLITKMAAGIVVDYDSYAILKKAADALNASLGAEIGNGKEPLCYRGKPVYMSPGFPPYTATLITHKPSCLFCHE